MRTWWERRADPVGDDGQGEPAVPGGRTGQCTECGPQHICAHVLAHARTHDRYSVDRTDQHAQCRAHFVAHYCVRLLHRERARRWWFACDWSHWNGG